MSKRPAAQFPAVSNADETKKSKISSEERDAANVCSWDILDDFTMLKVFEYVSILDRMRLEIVCKRWAGLLSDWWKQVTCLDWSDDIQDWSDRSIEVDHYPKLKVSLCSGPQLLYTLIKRCSSKLEEVRLSRQFGVSSLLRLIEEHCPTVTRLALTNGSLRPQEAAAMSALASRLKHLELDDSISTFSVCIQPRLNGFPFTHPGSRELFESCLQLESLVWKSSLHIIVSDSVPVLLPELPKCLRSLKLYGSYTLSQSSLVQFLNDHTDLVCLKLLVRLQLDSASGGFSAVLRAISPRLKFLTLPSENQNLAGHHLFMTPVNYSLGDMTLLGRLENLLKLNVRQVKSFGNAALEAVSEGCQQLQKLNIDCTSVRGNGLKCIAKLTKLTRLMIYALEDVNGEIVNRATTGLVNLLELCMVGDNFTAEDWVSLAHNCPHLRSVELLTLNDSPEFLPHFVETLMRSRKGSQNQKCRINVNDNVDTFSPEDYINPCVSNLIRRFKALNEG